MGENSGNDDEKPVHAVRVDAFDFAKFAVTNLEFLQFLRATEYEFPASLLNDEAHRKPVTGISWFDALVYCEWLSESTGARYRLPTEAEWEYAARSGKQTNIYPWGTRTWQDWPELHGRFKHGPEPVGSFEPNEFGLYEMGMNVHEWCSDWYDSGYYNVSPSSNPKGPASGKRRASRGGSWRHQIKITRCAARSSIPPSFRYADYGFRIVREVD